MKKLIAQVLKFGVVGGTAFLIDYGIMIALTEFCGINYLISSGISFVVSVIYNYILSVHWVFDVDKDGDKNFRKRLRSIRNRIWMYGNESCIWNYFNTERSRRID